MTTTKAAIERAHNTLQVFEYDEDPLLGNQQQEDVSLSLSSTSYSCCREYILTQKDPKTERTTTNKASASSTPSTRVAVVSRPWREQVRGVLGAKMTNLSTTRRWSKPFQNKKKARTEKMMKRYY
jgi:hypothetical protein